MSKKVYTTVGAFPTNRPIPVLEPGVKTGSGKATFKTATAAANAAREARDEARSLTNECASYLQQAAKAKEAASLYCESMHKNAKRDYWLIALLLLNILVDLFVLLTT
jgi:hypothetical protein